MIGYILIIQYYNNNDNDNIVMILLLRDLQKSVLIICTN